MLEPEFQRRGIEGEMVKAVDKKAIHINVSDLSLRALVKFFSQYNAVEKTEFVYMVYQEEEFLTCIFYRDIAMFRAEEELEFFIRYANIYTVEHTCFSQQEAERIFRENKYVYHYVLAEKPVRNKEFLLFYEKNPLLEKDILNTKYAELYEILRKKGINAFRVKIPLLHEINKHEKFQYVLSDTWLAMADGRDLLERNITKITDKSTDEVLKNLSKKKTRERIGCGKRKIYLVGPCLVAGWIHFEDEELAFVLSDMLSKRGCEYEIVKILQTRTVEDSLYKVLNHDIFDDDLVIFLDDLFTQYELDLKQVYDDYHGELWLYTDIPIHTTKKGNELIAETLIDKIILGEDRVRNKSDRVQLHGKQRVLRYDEEQGIEEYLESIPVKMDKDKELQIGAIVMNANPFTLGHRYLVETASAVVDFLYIFVVEEDRSYFAFRDRITMVQEGLKKLENIVVVPSGKFMISQGTFKSYFEKENKSEAIIDASMDIWIFAQYIAPRLAITKRFVGEEPFDKVTRQYNEQMKSLLPEYGIDLIEIPRKNGGGGKQIISASMVRNLLEKKEWEQISMIVPDTTLRYIQSGCTKREKQCVNNAMDAMRRYIGKCDKVIVYGTGNRTARMMEKMDSQTCGKLVFCDKKAREQDYIFAGKKVITPEKLYENYWDYNILITSDIYGKEIYVELRHHGIGADKIWCCIL